ncbi:MAG TPA: hypothetical protein DEB40_10215 [Elusimicrobia bacterium]|nr:hypothetical protein [Elusimicrobiota bacterium]HBT62103.1 hypothetical protein [Elusimicrobiota bacterium]
MIKNLLFVVASLALLTPAGQATEWHVLGTRAMGMGGAGVAVAEGPVGAYWNPASLARSESPSGVQVPVDAHMELTGNFLEGANDLYDISKDCLASGADNGRCTQSNINTALNKMNQGQNGLRADVAVGAHVKIKSMAFFVNNLAYIAGIPKVDFSQSANADFANRLNTSELILRGLNVTEIGMGYGRELPFLPGLMVGGNLKALVGKAGYYNFFVNLDSPGSSNALRKYLDNAKSSVQPGVDVGVLWDVHRTLEFVPMQPRIGLTARNINNPKFSNPAQAKNAGERDKYSLQGNARMGVAVSPLSFWQIAADADLSRNLTPTDGVATQNISLGTEINVFNRSWLNIPLRAGLARNVAMSGSKTALTAGLGLNFLHLTADISAMVTPARQRIKSQEKSEKIPAAIGVSAQVGFLFGGKKE